MKVLQYLVFIDDNDPPFELDEIVIKSTKATCKAIRNKIRIETKRKKTPYKNIKNYLEIGVGLP